MSFANHPFIPGERRLSESVVHNSVMQVALLLFSALVSCAQFKLFLLGFAAGGER